MKIILKKEVASLGEFCCKCLGISNILGLFVSPLAYVLCKDLLC